MGAKRKLPSFPASRRSPVISIQARINADLHKEVQNVTRGKGLFFRDVIEYSLRLFIADARRNIEATKQDTYRPPRNPPKGKQAGAKKETEPTPAA